MKPKLAHELARRACWIFDMDGTLTHAVHDFDEIRRALGLPESRPILESIELLPVEERVYLYQHLFEIELELARGATAQPGARALLERLCEQGRRLGVLTRNSEQLAHVTLAACGLDDLFEPDFVIGRERCAPKPDPAGILLLMESWGVTSEQVVMVGDYLFDLEAGRGAGTMTVHFNQHGDRAWPEHTDVLVNSLEHLMGHL
jgi:HAD superfamily hydrolase (TIGR01509 family)